MTKRKINHNEPNKKRKCIRDINYSLWRDFNDISNVKLIKNNINIWVSPTNIKNYMLNDPILDWIHMFYQKNEYNNNNKIKIINNNNNNNINTNNNLLFDCGNKFEECIFNYLNNKYIGKTIKIANTYHDLNDVNFNKTIKSMKMGTPIIQQAVLFNNLNKTRGIADLLVRSDWLNKLFIKEQLTKEEYTIKAPNLHGKYHYVVIDIKWTTLILCNNGILIRNSDMFPAYKSQLAIYTACVGLIQGYTPPKGYILGKSWKYTSKGIDYTNHNCFDLLGHIDYSEFDNDILNKTTKSIEWIRNLRSNGHKWKCIPPSIPELYPNMCNSYDSPYHNVKIQISEKIEELTQLWMVGYKNRKIAHQNNIYKWTDKECTPMKLGINNDNSTGKILTQIININKSNNCNKIYPNKIKNIKNNTYDWKNKSDIDFFIDFESINGCLYSGVSDLFNSKTEPCLIFMMGVGYKKKKWKYNEFHISYLNNNNNSTHFNYNQEKDMIQKFINLIEYRVSLYMILNNISDRKTISPKLFHWGNAEKTLMNNANNRHNKIWTNWINSVLWIDLCNIFKSEPIVIKDAFKFGLKEIAFAMHKHKFIKTIWSKDGPCNGLNAMMDAVKYYKNTVENTDIIKNIIKYNNVDCKILMEIIYFLRKL
jgi:hypothetical protein